MHGVGFALVSKAISRRAVATERRMRFSFSAPDICGTPPPLAAIGNSLPLKPRWCTPHRIGSQGILAVSPKLAGVHVTPPRTTFAEDAIPHSLAFRI